MTDTIDKKNISMIVLMKNVYGPVGPELHTSHTDFLMLED